MPEKQTQLKLTFGPQRAAPHTRLWTVGPPAVTSVQPRSAPVQGVICSWWNCLSLDEIGGFGGKNVESDEDSTAVHLTSPMPLKQPACSLLSVEQLQTTGNLTK